MSFVLNVRRFLNPGFHGGRASIIARYGNARLSKKGYPGGEPEATLEISDCSRTIYLEFDLTDSKSRRAAAFKANLLADTINAFRDALIADLEASATREVVRREYHRKADRKRRQAERITKA